MIKRTFAFIVLIFSATMMMAQNESQFISQSGIPDTVNAGEQFTFSITMKNTGSKTWTDAGNYHLGSQNPQDNIYWGNNRFVLPNDVPPGEQVTITGVAIAPNNQNPANFQWRMVQDGVEWFGEFSDLIQVVIPDAIVNNAQFVSQTVPESVHAGEQFSVSITFKNIGNTYWSEDSLYRLGSKMPDNNSVWGTNRIFINQGVTIAPDQEITLTAELTAPSTAGFYNFQWQMEREGEGWFGETTTPLQIAVLNDVADSLLQAYAGFSVSSHIVSTSFFTWFGPNEGQQSSPWIPKYGRDTWTGDVEFWKRMIKQVMMANIDVLYVELIPSMEDKRGNLFLALNELRRQGWDVPKVCPFLDPEITYSILGFHADCSTEVGKDELIGHYIRFYKQYYLANPDQYADDYIYTQDDHPVLNIWHIQLHIDNYYQLTRDDITSRLSAAFGEEHPVFNNDIKMINNAYSPCFSFTDERIYQFEMQKYKIDKLWKGINSSLLKPGYWDQNVRNPGYLLSRNGGSHYSESWNAVNNDTSIDRVYIESFNEYDEGSGIYAARTDTIFKKTDGGMNNTGNDVWSLNNKPYEYILTTAGGAAEFNDDAMQDAQVLWNSIPDVMSPGESFNAKVLIRNKGNQRWKGTDGFAFGEMDSMDDTLFSADHFVISDTLFEIPEYDGVFRGRTILLNLEILAPTTPGVYQTHWGMLQEGNQWFGDTLVKQITVKTSGIEYSSENFTVFPNPATDFITVNGVAPNSTITIRNLLGVVVYQDKIVNGKTVDIRSLSHGAYFIQIGNNKKKIVVLD